jgi:hypothetical protein
VITFVVPTMPGRESLLSRCLWSIFVQGGKVMVVQGSAKLGTKINHAAQLVDTPYMTVVDDDDYITSDYLIHVLPRLGLVDYIGFKVLEIVEGKYYNTCASVGDYEHWGIRTRGPVPKCVTRTDHFRAVKFGNKYTADRSWSGAIRERISTWSYVDRPLYVHDWWPHEFGETAERDVGLWPIPGVEERITVDAD